MIPSVSDTVLAAVLAAHGERCNCAGSCGTGHAGRSCGAGLRARNVTLIAAPQYPHATDHENAAAPLEELRPWCWSCWRQALTRARERAADVRRRQLEADQIPLFTVDRITGRLIPA